MHSPIRRICIFCGSRPGVRAEYAEQARRLGALLAERGIGLVYGGASVGLMGLLADAALSANGEVIGVLPSALADRELAHTRVTDLRIVATMHERKQLMSELADAFIAMPGGFGTFEELFEMVTWAQLGMHQKPFGVLNVAGFFDGLLALVDHAVEEGFVPAANRQLILSAPEPAELLDRVLGYEPPPPVAKWIRPGQT